MTGRPRHRTKTPEQLAKAEVPVAEKEVLREAWGAIKGQSREQVVAGAPSLKSQANFKAQLNPTLPNKPGIEVMHEVLIILQAQCDVLRSQMDAVADCIADMETSTDEVVVEDSGMDDHAA